MPAVRAPKSKSGRSGSPSSSGSNAQPKRSPSTGKKPRPPNAFILFRSHIVSNRLVPATITHQSEVSQYVANLWASLSDPERHEFFQMARLEKERREAGGIELASYKETRSRVSCSRLSPTMSNDTRLSSSPSVRDFSPLPIDVQTSSVTSYPQAGYVPPPPPAFNEFPSLGNHAPISHPQPTQYLPLGPNMFDIQSPYSHLIWDCDLSATVSPNSQFDFDAACLLMDGQNLALGGEFDAMFDELLRDLSIADSMPFLPLMNPF